MVEVLFQNPGRHAGLRLRSLRPWTLALLMEVAKEADSLVVRFVTNTEMRALNSRYRDMDKTTDVLSFPGTADLDGYHLGDVVISVPVAKRQSDQAGHGLETEVKVLVLHGVLHCLGYDHETDRGQMVRLERRLRRRFLEIHKKRTD